MIMSGERVQPIKCSLRFKPPILALIYKDNDTGKTRKRSMPLRGFSAETDVESYAKKLLATPRHADYISTIPLSQLHSLLQRVKDAHQDEGRGGPSQTTTPIHSSVNPLQSSLRDIPPLSPLSTPVKSNKNEDRENKQFEEDFTTLLNLDGDDLELAGGKHETLPNAVTNGFNGFGGTPPKTSSDDVEDDPFLKVLQGKIHSPLQESLAGPSTTKVKFNKNERSQDTEASTKRLTSLGTKEPESTAPFSLSSHSVAQRSDNKLPPLKRRPLGDIPSLSPSKTTPVKSKQEDKETKRFEKDIGDLLDLDDDFQPESKPKNGMEGSPFDGFVDSKDKSTAVDDDACSDEDDDPFWKALKGKVQSPVHKFETPSVKNVDQKREKQKETEAGLTSLGIMELPPLIKTPLSSVIPQPTVTTETAANEVSDYSEGFDSESHEISRGGRKVELLDDFADDKSLSFAVKELDEDEDSLGIDLGDNANQLSGSFSGEDFRNIVTSSSLSAPIVTNTVPQSTNVITGAQPSNEDLNKASDEYVSKRKEEMEVMFLTNQVKPGDEGYVYNKEVDFDQGPKIESCEWDTDSEMSDF